MLSKENRFKAGALLLLSAAALAAYTAREPRLKLRFDHPVHVERVGAECIFCHTPESDYPGHEACSSCHHIDERATCSGCHIDEVTRGRPASHTPRWALEHGRIAEQPTVRERCLYCHNNRIWMGCDRCH